MSSKLRASCDACHKAKVKCTAGVVECLRCHMMGKKCQYSPALPRVSQRKRLNSSNGSDSGSSPVADPSVNQDNLSTVLLSAPSHTKSLEPRTDDIMELVYPTSLDLDLADMQWNNWEPQEGLKNWSSLSEASSSHHCDAVVSPLPTHLSAVSVSSRRDPSAECDEGPSGLSNDLGSPQANQRSRHSVPMGVVTGSSNHLISCGNQVGMEQNQNDPVEDHATCFSKLLAAIQNVHKSPTTPIDVALKVNQEAVACCLSTMRCSCTKKFNLLIISCGLLELVLNLYQLALEKFCGGDGTGSSGIVENLQGSAPKPPPVQLKLGGLDIGKEDQQFFVRELVTRAICKIEETILPTFRSAVGAEAQDVVEALVLHLSRKSKVIIGRD